MNATARVREFLSNVLPARCGNFERNAVQLSYAASVGGALENDLGTFHFIEGDTGIGKTLAYLLHLADWAARGESDGRRVVIATQSRALQRQLLDDTTQVILADYLRWAGLRPLSIGLRMGRLNYVAPHRLATAMGVESLQEVLDSKTATTSDKSLAAWGLSGGLLDEIETDDVLPDGITAYDIALRPSDDLPECVQEAFEQTQESDIQIINHALLTLDLVFGSKITETGGPTALMLDEAEHFQGMAEKLLSDRLNLRSAHYLLSKHRQKRAASKVNALVNAWKSEEDAGGAALLSTSMRKALSDVLGAIKKAKSYPGATKERKLELKELKQTATKVLDRLNHEDESLAVSFSSQKGTPIVVRLDEGAGGIIKINHQRRLTLLTSATLSDGGQTGPMQHPTFNHLRKQLLFQVGDPRIVTMASYQSMKFGELTFRILGADCAALLSDDEDNYWLNPVLCGAIWHDLSHNAPVGRTLLLCSSYRDVELLSQTCPPSLRRRLVTHLPGESVSVIASRLPEDAILITPAGWEGLSPVREGRAFWSHVGIVRNPTPCPDAIKEIVRERRMSHTMPPAKAIRAAKTSLMAEAKVKTLHKLRQGIGRAIRHPDDSATVTFYDPRFPTNGKQAREFQWLEGAVPFRFMPALHQAQWHPIIEHEPFASAS